MDDATLAQLLTQRVVLAERTGVSPILPDLGQRRFGLMDLTYVNTTTNRALELPTILCPATFVPRTVDCTSFLFLYCVRP